MKTHLSQNRLLTRTAFMVTAGLLSVSLCMSSCKKKTEEEPEPEKVITTDDAADVVSYTMESSSGGYTEQVSDGATYVYQFYNTASTHSLSCGIPFDTTVVRSHSGTVNATYTHQRHYLMNCDTASTPLSVMYSGTYNGNFDGPRMSSTNSGNRSWTITGLAPAATSYMYSGSLTRSGSHTSKVRNQYTFTSDLQVTTSNLTVNKSTRKITGGTGSVSITCVVVGGSTYSFTGTIVFNSNDTATLTINGTSYTINLY
jgi:hypothetical protein